MRRKSTGLQLGQMMRMLRECGVTHDATTVRNAVSMARSAASSDRLVECCGEETITGSSCIRLFSE